MQVSGWGTYEIRLSIDVSIGFVFNDLRNDARPGVKATAGGILIRYPSGYCFQLPFTKLPVKLSALCCMGSVNVVVAQYQQ